MAKTTKNDEKRRPKVVIACQGGGSHTAFTAGVLASLFENWPTSYKLVGLSGTSGGALCAALAWGACLEGKASDAPARLLNFWQDNSAKSPLEMFLNSAMVMSIQTKGLVPHLEVSPYQLPSWGSDHFRNLLEKHFDFASWNSLKTEQSPKLYVGAVEVLEGRFEVFNSSEHHYSVDTLLASAAIPNLFRAVEVNEGLYWDGLFSHNPPLIATLDSQPDEIWIIQINPRSIDKEPTTTEEIQDRRNELAGNLSLEQEVASIKMINAMLARGELQNSRCCPIKLRRVELKTPLGYASKLDRNPAFLKSLIEEGQKEGQSFLTSL